MVPRLPRAFLATSSARARANTLSFHLQGTIEKADKDGYKVGGLIERIDDSTIEITELPVRTWTQSYKEQLESWVVGTEKAPALVKVCSLAEG